MLKFLFLLLVLISPLSACGDGGGGLADPTDTVSGTYGLVQMNGSALPAPLGEFAAGRLDVVNGTLTLRSDKSYTEAVDIRTTPRSGAVRMESITDAGTYAVTGNTVQFKTALGETYSGSIGGNTVSYTAGGAAVTYRKP